MTRIAIIPARSGSKRIPNKNIIDFFGKPIIAYAIETALRSNLFDEVMVSTDSKEISEIARNHRAKVPFLRTAENASDKATTAEAILEVLHYYHRKGKTFDYCCCIYPATPLNTSSNLKKGFDILEKSSFDTIFPAVAYGHPVQRGFVIDLENKIKLLEPNTLLKNTQKLEKVYHDAGQFYWFRPDVFMTKRTLITENSSVFEVNGINIQDIDTPNDLLLAKLKYKIINETEVL